MCPNPAAGPALLSGGPRSPCCSRVPQAGVPPRAGRGGRGRCPPTLAGRLPAGLDIRRDGFRRDLEVIFYRRDARLSQAAASRHAQLIVEPAHRPVGTFQGPADVVRVNPTTKPRILLRPLSLSNALTLGTKKPQLKLVQSMPDCRSTMPRTLRRISPAQDRGVAARVAEGTRHRIRSPSQPGARAQCYTLRCPWKL